MNAGISPWWQRGWQGFWTNQRTSLRLEDPMGQYQYDDRRHTITWTGCLRAKDGRRWEIEIRWGPGTPFLAPRIYLGGVYSQRHQLRDGSLCLAPAGLAQVVEIDTWLDWTRTWLERYQREGWSMDEAAWQVHRLVRPDPEYRLHERPRSYVLFPADWSPKGELGEFFARLPLAGGGLGTLLRWQDASDGAWHNWDSGAAYAPPAGEELPGFWIREWNGTLSGPFMTWLARPARQTAPFLLGFPAPSESATSSWQFAYCDLQEDLSFWNRLVPIGGGPRERVWNELSLASFVGQHILPGLPLASDTVAARTKVSRSKEMDTRIRDACVVIVGLGALGSEVAHLLAKEQVGHFVLIDGDLMLPGNVARHRLDLHAIGGNKAEKLREHLLRHHPGANVEAVSEMLDEALPHLKLPEGALLLGLTGSLPSERILAALASRHQLPCVHAWTECDGRLLRLLRARPERDAGLHELCELPEIPWTSDSDAQDECAQLLLPGSSINLHAAANRTARLVLEVLSAASPSSLPAENHLFFTAEGLGSEAAGIPAELRSPYGQLSALIGSRG